MTIHFLDLNGFLQNKESTIYILISCNQGKGREGKYERIKSGFWQESLIAPFLPTELADGDTIRISYGENGKGGERGSGVSAVS